MKKTICIVLALLITLSLFACDGTDTPTGANETPSNSPVGTMETPSNAPVRATETPSNAPAGTMEPSSNAPAGTMEPPSNAPVETTETPSGEHNNTAPPSSESPEQTLPQISLPANCVFDSGLFDGKLQSCAYAGNGKLFVVADKLYLYDTTTASVLAVTEMPLRNFYVQIVDGGYVLSGMGSNGAMAYIYNDSLSLNKKIAVNDLLTGDAVVSETGVAASADGKKLAISTMRRLYLYDLESGTLTTLLDFTQNAGTSSIRISMLIGIAFTQNDNRLTFGGKGLSIPAVNGEDSFPIYGSVAVDGSDLKLTKPSAYDIDEMQNRAARLFFPQNFTKSNGSLLWIDGQTGRENILTFSTSAEGKNGVFSSEQGNYVATTVLDSNLTIRVYEVDSGKLIATKVIENANNTYFKRVPRIYLLDGANTAVVLLGGSISEIDTLVSTFEFGA